MCPLRFLPLVAIALLFTQCKSNNAHLDPAGVGTGAPPEVSVPDDWARFLAGMPGGRSSAFFSARQTTAWKRHQEEMDRMFGQGGNSRHGGIAGWQGGALGGLGSRFVFYPFGGPDFLYANAMFPGASEFVLVGLEDAAGLPPAEAVAGADLDGILGNLRASLGSVTRNSFFITKDMRSQLGATRLRGALPPILVFLARSGHRVQAVEPVSLAADGGLMLAGSSATASGFRIRANGGTKEICYFQENLGNENLGRNPRLIRHVQSRGRPVTFLKSASYLLHQERFSVIRKAILEESRAVVTDPSGMPFSAMETGNWDIALYGSYDGPISTFAEFPQPSLSAAYSSGGYPVKSLPFGLGYSQRTLVVARRR